MVFSILESCLVLPAPRIYDYKTISKTENKDSVYVIPSFTIVDNYGKQDFEYRITIANKKTKNILIKKLRVNVSSNFYNICFDTLRQRIYDKNMRKYICVSNISLKDSGKVIDLLLKSNDSIVFDLYCSGTRTNKNFKIQYQDSVKIEIDLNRYQYSYLLKPENNTN